MSDKNKYPIFDSLKEIAESKITTPEQVKDLKYAALALHFISMKGHQKDFGEFVEEMNSPLTKEQVEHLKSMGITP